jgi:hypothetical protein
MPTRTASVILIRPSQRLTRLAGEIALPGFSVFLSLLVIAGAAFACYKFEVHLSMPEEDR